MQKDRITAKIFSPALEAIGVRTGRDTWMVILTLLEAAFGQVWAWENHGNLVLRGWGWVHNFVSFSIRLLHWRAKKNFPLALARWQINQPLRNTCSVLHKAFFIRREKWRKALSEYYSMEGKNIYLTPFTSRLRLREGAKKHLWEKHNLRQTQDD